ncbi:alpha-(1,6)-fucosyltransferase [Agrilus planipennis]|uniref:Alpha-(1,6)-fucosyltransferase n=1 Tax=Agrilus planipennis TaxID=224129 RepID=A0A1W4XMA5_AGRPL|nr:alpha-(1,6)-fucosyltransferase [Agrilus planipennis]
MSAIIRQVASLGWNRLLVFFLAAWLVILVLVFLPFLNSQSQSVTDSGTADRLKRVISDLEILRKQNLELQKIIKDINLGDLQSNQKQSLEKFKERLIKTEDQLVDPEKGYTNEKDDPNSQYEITRRRVENGVREWWYFSNSEIKKLKDHINNVAPDLSNSINKILSLGAEHKRSLLHDIDFLSEADGYAKWREKEAESLSNIVQERLRYLQNPTDCANAKKLICNINKGCGYGCELHHVVYCFMVAYGTQRTLILKSKGWRYNKAGWETIFKPVSDTCTDPSGKSVKEWSGHPDAQVISLPIIDYVNPKPQFLPPAVPKDLALRLARLHGDPQVWWVGQFLKYLFRPQEATERLLNEAAKSMSFVKPIVGVHVRRTDKIGTEASFHSIEEYMVSVEDYYDVLEMKEKDVIRRVYIASDDPKVITEARKKYPNYEILGDPQVSMSAAVETRFTENSLKGIILDIHFLSQCDYLVCTFSSQVCRLAYEIMQNNYPDASARFRSLDDIYYYGGQNPHYYVAVLPHKAEGINEIDLKVGDLVGVAGNHWDGYSKGRNMRTNQLGLFPSFKIKNTVESVAFPTYSEINEKRDS